MTICYCSLVYPYSLCPIDVLCPRHRPHQLLLQRRTVQARHAIHVCDTNGRTFRETQVMSWLPDGYCQILICIRLSLWAWMTMAPLRCKICSLHFLGLRPLALHPGAIQGKEGIKFCSVAIVQKPKGTNEYNLKSGYSHLATMTWPVSLRVFAHLHGKQERHVELVLFASAAGVDEGNGEDKAHQ